jgi:hypothetical protein
MRSLMNVIKNGHGVYNAQKRVRSLHSERLWRGCGFRGKAASDSAGRRPPNPIQSGHRFRSKAATLLMGVIPGPLPAV